MGRLKRVGNRLCRVGTVLSTVECGCNDGPPTGPNIPPADPCTREGCDNGFVNSQGEPEPSPIVGCVRDENGDPRTCLFVSWTMQVVENPNYGPIGPDPRVQIDETWSGSKTLCFGDDDPDLFGVSGVDCCSGRMATGSLRPTLYVNGDVRTRFGFDVSATTNGVVGLFARYENTGPGGSGINHRHTIGGFDLTTTNALTVSQDPWQGAGFIGDTTPPDVSSSLLFRMVPIFREGAGGVQQVVGAVATWEGLATRPVFGSGGVQLVYNARFTGEVTIRLLNLVPYDPECPEPPAALQDPNDPRALLTPDNAFKGGCCG